MHSACYSMPVGVDGTRAPKLLVVALVALVLAASASVALAGQLALVVGSSLYARIGRLPDPENDVVDLSAGLRRLGFEVTTELDADRVELTQARCGRSPAGARERTSRWSSTPVTASRWTASTTWCRSTRGWSATSTCATSR